MDSLDNNKHVSYTETNLESTDDEIFTSVDFLSVLQALFHFISFHFILDLPISLVDQLRSFGGSLSLCFRCARLRIGVMFQHLLSVRSGYLTFRSPSLDS